MKVKEPYNTLCGVECRWQNDLANICLFAYIEISLSTKNVAFFISKNKIIMKHKKINLLILLFVTLLWTCNSENYFIEETDETDDQVLLLKVNYLTNTFEGGVELALSQQVNDFTIEPEYKLTDDFSYVKMTYKELDETLFEGSVHSERVGEIRYPKNLMPPHKFKALITHDFVTPVNGFEEIFNPQNIDLDHSRPWYSVQSLLKVREYLNENPSQVVKLFLYTPNLDKENSQDWCWIYFLKK